MSQRENSSPEAAQREAASILKQVERDSQSIVLGGLPSASRATSEPEPEPDDAMELWGRKIGRALAVIAAGVAVIWLLIKLD